MLKPQDIVVAVGLQLRVAQRWRIIDLAEALHLSGSEVYAALQRLEMASLFDAEDRRIRPRAFRELLLHGVRYVYYPEWKRRCRGVPTAWSAQPLHGLLALSPESAIVWPDPQGDLIGEGLVPLYRTVPMAALADPDLHSMLALVDALRVGGTREVRLATELLDERLLI